MPAARFKISPPRPETRWHASEKEIQQCICDWLTLQKIPFSVTDAARFKTRTGRVHYNSATIGWPDIVICLPPHGRFLGLEVKNYRGRVRDEQTVTHERLKQAGGLVYVVRSVDEVIAILEQSNSFNCELNLPSAGKSK